MSSTNLEKIAQLTKDATMPGGPASYPAGIKTAAQRTLYNNLGQDEALAVAVDVAVLSSLQDDWRNSVTKTKRVRHAIRHVLGTVIFPNAGLQVQQVGSPPPTLDLETATDRILDLVKHQTGY